MIHPEEFSFFSRKIRDVSAGLCNMHSKYYRNVLMLHTTDQDKWFLSRTCIILTVTCFDESKKKKKARIA